MSPDARNSKQLKHNSLSRVVSAHLFIIQSVTCVALYLYNMCTVCGLKQLKHYSKYFFVRVLQGKERHTSLE